MLVNALLSVLKPYIAVGLGCLLSALALYSGWEIFKHFKG